MSGATLFMPLDSAVTADIMSAYGNLSTANQRNLLLYHVLPRYYNRTQVVVLSNVSMLAAIVNNSTASYCLMAVNQSNSNGVITVYASKNSANIPPASPLPSTPFDPSPPHRDLQQGRHQKQHLLSYALPFSVAGFQQQ
jgi:hypothetical protein